MTIAEVVRSAGFVNRWLRYNPIYARRARALLEAYDHADEAQRRALAQALLDRSIAWARKSAYGRARGDAYEGWPVLTKEAIREDPGRFRTRGLAVSASTGGTTGTPLKLWRSLECVAVERVFIDRLLAPHGHDLGRSRVAVLRADEVKDPGDDSPPFGVYRNAGRTLVLSNAHLSEKTIRWFLGELEAFRPAVLYAYPSMLENLIRLARSVNGSLAIPVALTSSESVSPELFENVATRLGGRLIDFYGHGERTAFAYSRGPRDYVLSPLYGKVELRTVAPPSNVEDPGDALYEIVATGFWNKAMPLVRYATGDFVVFPADSDALGRVEIGEAGFPGIQGRTSEYLVGPAGQVIAGLNHVPRGVPRLLRLQFVQEAADRVTIHLATLPGFSPADQDLLLANVRRLVPKEMKIRVVAGDLTRAPNGKTPTVIRSVASPIA